VAAYRCRRFRPREFGASLSIKNDTPLKRLGPCLGPYQYRGRALAGGAGSRGAAGCGSCSMLVLMRASADSTTAGCGQQPGRCSDRVDRACMRHTMGRRACARTAWVGRAQTTATAGPARLRTLRSAQQQAAPQRSRRYGSAHRRMRANRSSLQGQGA
jgi:hypothetical protein